MDPKPALLLTATITPQQGIQDLARTDPRQRLEDYKHALSFYLPMIGPVFDCIVFAENSESDLDELRALADRQRVEFLSLRSDHPAEYGRGFGEMQLITRAVRNSPWLYDAPFIWKATGRYEVRNMAKLVKSTPFGVDLYVNCRNYPHRWCDLSVMGFTTRGFEQVLSGACLNNYVLGPRVTEEKLFRLVVDAAHVPVRKRFRHTPQIQGVRGWNAQPYRSGLDPVFMLRRIAGKVGVWV